MTKKINIVLMSIFITSLSIGTYFYLKNFILKENYSSIINLNTQKAKNQLILTLPYVSNQRNESDYQQYQCNMRTKFAKETGSCGSIIGISQLPQDSNSPQEFLNF